jgi:hypothetical protein
MFILPAMTSTVRWYSGYPHWQLSDGNATFLQDGKNDGKKQVLITLGIVVRGLPLTTRLGLSLGAGLQIAASKFYTTQHNFIVSVRLSF